MDPTFTLRARLTSKFGPDDSGRQASLVRNLTDIEAELLDEDETPAARMLGGGRRSWDTGSHPGSRPA